MRLHLRWDQVCEEWECNAAHQTKEDCWAMPLLVTLFAAKSNLFWDSFFKLWPVLAFSIKHLARCFLFPAGNRAQ